MRCEAATLLSVPDLIALIEAKSSFIAQHRGKNRIEPICQPYLRIFMFISNSKVNYKSYLTNRNGSLNSRLGLKIGI